MTASSDTKPGGDFGQKIPVISECFSTPGLLPLYSETEGAVESQAFSVKRDGRCSSIQVETDFIPKDTALDMLHQKRCTHNSVQ